MEHVLRVKNNLINYSLHIMEQGTHRKKYYHFVVGRIPTPEGRLRAPGPNRWTDTHTHICTLFYQWGKVQLSLKLMSYLWLIVWQLICSPSCQFVVLLLDILCLFQRSRILLYAKCDLQPKLPFCLSFC